MSAAQGRDGRAPLRDHRSKSPRHSLNSVTFPDAAVTFVGSSRTFAPSFRHAPPPVRGCYSRRRRHSRASRRRDPVPGCTRSCRNRWRSVAGICTLETLSTRARTSREQLMVVAVSQFSVGRLRVPGTHSREPREPREGRLRRPNVDTGVTLASSRRGSLPVKECEPPAGRAPRVALSPVSRGGNKKKRKVGGHAQRATR